MATKIDPIWQNLQKIYRSGLASHTGLEVGLSQGQLRLSKPPYQLRAVPTIPLDQLQLDPAIWQALPDKGLPYPALNEFVFGRHPESWLTGAVQQGYVGYATDPISRRGGASGGVLTQTLLYLLESRKITGAVTLRLRKDNPGEPEPFIARTRQEILAASGSVYTEAAPLTILEETAREDGTLAFIGLPDHVAAIRMLQKIEHPSVRSIKYVFGPYTGTILQFQALRSYLSANQAHLSDVTHLSYRAGEWPGYLEIQLQDGRILKAEKFYYNYLIPFFITNRTSRLAVDFTNELTDISVGDAWAPEYEKKRGGYSVILARTDIGKQLLEEMEHKEIVSLTKIHYQQIIDMHAHMIDFKKRGSFIRMQWRSLLGKPNPHFGYQPTSIPSSRYFIEAAISGLFLLGGTDSARWISEHIPLPILGPIFNWMRLSWKAVSKGQKRSGLSNARFRITSTSTSDF